MNKLLTYAVMLDTFIVVYIRFRIILTELKKMPGQEVKCLCSMTTTVLLAQTVPEYGCESFTLLSH